jgi:hypothetical protein
MSTMEFGSGLRAKLAGDRGVTPVDQRPFYELLENETLIFRRFKPTAPRLRRRRRRARARS